MLFHFVIRKWPSNSFKDNTWSKNPFFLADIICRRIYRESDKSLKRSLNFIFYKAFRNWHDALSMCICRFFDHASAHPTVQGERITAIDKFFIERRIAGSPRCSSSIRLLIFAEIKHRWWSFDRSSILRFSPHSIPSFRGISTSLIGKNGFESNGDISKTSPMFSNHLR
jgi:hypothetical protein